MRFEGWGPSLHTEPSAHAEAHDRQIDCIGITLPNERTRIKSTAPKLSYPVDRRKEAWDRLARDLPSGALGEIG